MENLWLSPPSIHSEEHTAICTALYIKSVSNIISPPVSPIHPNTPHFSPLSSHAWNSKLQSPHEPVCRGMTMLLTYLLHKRRVVKDSDWTFRTSVIGESTSDCCALRWGSGAASQPGEKKMKNVTLNQQETKWGNHCFLCLLLYVWTIKRSSDTGLLTGAKYPIVYYYSSAQLPSEGLCKTYKLVPWRNSLKDGL